LLANRAMREDAPAGQQGTIRAAQLLLLDSIGIDVTEEVKK